MSFKPRAGRLGEKSDGGSEVDELIRCVLNRFRQVSVNRIHKLSFIVEYEWKRTSSQKLTNASYYRVADACRSDSISASIDELSEQNPITRKSVSVGRETVKTIICEEDLHCGLSEDEQNTVDRVVKEYGEEPPEIVNDAIMSIPEYQDTKLGEEIRF